MPIRRVACLNALTRRGLKRYLESFEPQEIVGNPSRRLRSEENVLSKYVEYLYPEFFIGGRRARSFPAMLGSTHTKVFVYSPDEGDLVLWKVGPWPGWYLNTVQASGFREAPICASEALDILERVPE